MTKLESTKQVNKIKLSAINNGGYDKNKNAVLSECKRHFEQFGDDLTPKCLK